MSVQLTCLVFGILSKVVETTDLQLEFSTLAKLSKACSESNEVGPGDGSCQVHGLHWEVVDPRENIISIFINVMNKWS